MIGRWRNQARAAKIFCALLQSEAKKVLKGRDTGMNMDRPAPAGSGVSSLTPGVVETPPLHSAELRVASLIDTAIVSGPGRQLTALASQLGERGVKLRVYMFQRAGRSPSPFIAYLERAGVEHVVLPDNGPLDISLLVRLGRSLREWKPDIVQTHNYRTTVMAYLLKRANPPWPWIAFFHGSTDESWKVRLYNRIDGTLLPRADRLVVMSERHKRDFSAAGEKVRVIHNAILAIPSESSPVELGAIRRPGVPLIGAIGRLSPEKGVDVLIEAVSLLPARSVSIVLAGNGPERAALEQQAVALGLRSDIHFLGTVEDVASLYRQLDLVVLPSRSEGLPNVLLEALSADVPVVATAVGAVPEVLTDEAAGRIVAPGDPYALAEAIRQSLEQGRSASAKRARAAVAEHFSLEKRVRRHLSLYSELRPDRIVAGFVP
jgi:glycosyltransferase involved in cell wall biosynthesis